MYKTYQLTDAEKEKYAGLIISSWDGDTYSYIICENKEEYTAEKLRVDRIDEDYIRAYSQYLDSIH